MLPRLQNISSQHSRLYIFENAIDQETSANVAAWSLVACGLPSVKQVILSTRFRDADVYIVILCLDYERERERERELR